jgi:hypothetical protein
LPERDLRVPIPDAFKLACDKATVVGLSGHALSAPSAAKASPPYSLWLRLDRRRHITGAACSRDQDNASVELTDLGRFR